MPDLSDERHLFIVNGEQDEEYNRWYRTVHIPDVLAAVPGIVSGQLFRLKPAEPGGASTELRPYLAVYEIAGDPAKAVAALREAREQGKLRPSPSAGHGRSTSAVFEPVTAKLTPADD